MNSSFSAIILLTLAVVGSATHRAQAHFDYLIAQDGTGRLVSGGNNFDNGNKSIPLRVFGGGLDEDFFSSDPGFSAVTQGSMPDGCFALPGNSTLSLDLVAMPLHAMAVSNLWYWNGENGVNFQPASFGTTLSLTIGMSTLTADGSNADVPGFAIQTTSSEGSIHRHPSYQFQGGPGGITPEGVFMIAEQVRMAGLHTSIPFYTLFVTAGTSTGAFSTALDWATAHLTVPGDVNNDAIVNGQDIAVVASHWLASGPIADANYDGIVNGQDIALIASNWLATPAADLPATAVPEPSTWLLLLASLAVTKAGWRQFRVERST